MVEIIKPTKYYTVTCPACRTGLKYIWSEVYRKERCIFTGHIECKRCSHDVVVCDDFHYDYRNDYIDEGLLDDRGRDNDYVHEDEK